MLNLYNYSNNISDLEKGNDTCITSNSIFYGPYILARNQYLQKITNTYFYFAPHGSSTLFDFLVAGSYLKICKDGRYSTRNNIFTLSFTEDYSISSSSLNSLANSAILPHECVTSDGFYYSSLNDGEIEIHQLGSYPFYQYIEMILRYDIRIPKSSQRSSIAGSIDFVLVYTYTT